MKTIRIGLLGSGFMAATHLKAYAKVPGTEVVALCNPSGRNLDGDFSNVSGNVGDADAVKLDMKRVAPYRDSVAFFADKSIDCVDICTPTATHVDLCLGALAANKHVLVEKPLARTSIEARKIVAAAKIAAERNVFLMPAHCMRFWPEWRWLKDAIDAGTYGKILSARFRRVAEPPAWGHGHFLDGAKSGGALLDLHIHDVDFVQYCFGAPTSVTASGYSRMTGSIDHVSTNYRFQNGTLVTAEGAWCFSKGFGFQMEFTANFEHATLDFNSSRGTDAMRIIAEDGFPTKVISQDPDGYVGQIRYFADCIRSGRPPQRVCANDGFRAVELCETEEKSIRDGVPVLFQPHT